MAEQTTADQAKEASKRASKAADTHVTMVRDESQYPAPHVAQVHKDEVRNWYAGGWEVK